MDQVLRATHAEDQASDERSGLSANPSPQPALHSSQSDAGPRGIKFPISNFLLVDREVAKEEGQ